MTLSGRTALITGGSRGIGWAIAQAFAREGAAICLLARASSLLAAASAELRAAGAHAMAAPADVRDPDAVAAAFQSAQRELGAISILVNAAAIQGPIGAIDEVPPAAWRTAIEANLLGTFHCMQAALPGMKALGGGHILNFAGGGAATARPRFSAYAASKAAIVRLTETAALEMEPYCVQINAISPGAVNTQMLEEVLAAGDRAGEEFGRAMLQKRQGGESPGRAAALALFLVSPQARGISGRLLSAIWDDWESLPKLAATLPNSDLFTLRRVDEAMFRAMHGPRKEAAGG